jgi:hypothetical protein
VRPDETASVRIDRTAPAPPTGTRQSGTFTAPFLFALQAEPTADIRYGVGNNAPSLPFGGALNIASDTTIRATARDQAGNVSPVSTFTFTRTVAPPAQPTPGTPATSTTTVIQVVPGLGAAAAPAAPAGPAAQGVQGIQVTSPAAVRNLTLSQRISITRLRIQGLRLSMQVPSGANVVRVAIYKARNGRKTGRALFVGYRNPARAGQFRTTLRDRSMLRKLKAGQYVIEVRPGASRSALGATTLRTFRVTR